MATSSKLFSSRRWRIAATRPSIMSEGATISAPARACESAASASSTRLGIIQHFAIVDHAAMAVAGVFAEADVGNYQQIELGFANGFNRALHRALRRRSFRGEFVFMFRQGQTESRRKFPDRRLRGTLPRSDPRIADRCRASS